MYIYIYILFVCFCFGNGEGSTDLKQYARDEHDHWPACVVCLVLCWWRTMISTHARGFNRHYCARMDAAVLKRLLGLLGYGQWLLAPPGPSPPLPSSSHPLPFLGPLVNSRTMVGVRCPTYAPKVTHFAMGSMLTCAIPMIRNNAGWGALHRHVDLKLVRQRPRHLRLVFARAQTMAHKQQMI